jgi:hypothetical protein
MQSEKPPAWAQQRKTEWEQYKHSRDQLTSDADRRRDEMIKAVAPEA